MTKRKRNHLEQNLFSSLIAYRLHQETLIIEREIENVNSGTEEEKKGIHKIIEKVKEPFRGHQEKKANDDYVKACNNLHDYISSLDKDIDYSAYNSEEKIRKLMDVLFHKSDKTLRLSLGLELAISTGVNNNKYLRDEQSLRMLSSLLFDDENKMMNLRNTYLCAYKKIDNKKYLDNLSLGVIIGSTSLALTLINPFLTVLAGASVASIYLLRKNKVMSKPDESLLLFSTLVSSGKIKHYKSIEKAFKNVDKESLIHSLVTGLVIYNFNFVDKDTPQAKEALSNYIQMIDDIRGDEEYFLIVEKTDRETHHQKIEICNRIISFLEELVTAKTPEKVVETSNQLVTAK